MRRDSGSFVSLQESPPPTDSGGDGEDGGGGEDGEGVETVPRPALKTPTMICGWLKKRDSRSIFGRSTWRTRWFEMNRKTCVLTYFMEQPLGGSSDMSRSRRSGLGGETKNDSEEEPHAIIDVRNYTVRDLGGMLWELMPYTKEYSTAAASGSGESSTKERKREKITKRNSKTSSDRVWRFRADDADHKNMWMAAMKLCSRDGGAKSWKSNTSFDLEKRLSVASVE